MNCSACSQRDSCGARAIAGDPGNVSASITGEQVVQIACALARVGTLLCDIGGVGSDQERDHPRVGHVGGASLLHLFAAKPEPYIWDVD